MKLRNVTETRDRNGNVQFSASYTPYGEILQVNPGQGRTAKIRYNDNGDPIARWTIDEAGTQFLTITYFDDERRSTGSVTAKLPAGQTIEQNFETATIPPQFIQSQSSTEHNAIGQAVAAVDSNGLRSETTYDIDGRVIQTRTQSRATAAGNATQSQWNVVRTVYDAAGRAIAQTESYPEGTTDPIRATRTLYDSAGRVVSTYQVLGIAIQFNGPAGALESVIAAPGTTVPNTTSSTQYDASGRVVQTTDPYGRISTTTYNAKGKKRTCIAFWSVMNCKRCVGSLSGGESGVDEYRPGRFQDVRCGQGLTWNGFLPRQRAKSVQSVVAVNLSTSMGRSWMAC